MRAVRIIALAAVAALNAAALTAPTPFATVGLAGAPPDIDGKLDDACWQPGASAALTHFVLPDMTALAKAQTVVRVCRDEQHLYVAARCEEPNMQGLRVEAKHRDGAVWRDDCVEFFIDANHDRKSWRHIIVNSAGVVFDQVNRDAKWNAALRVKSSAADACWVVEMAVPFADLGGAPSKGDVWGFNVGRERYAGDEHLSIWSPTYGKFHEPARFGEIVFDDRPGSVLAEFVGQPMFGPARIELLADRAAKPVATLTRDWPESVARDWETPAPKTTPRQGEAGAAAGRAWDVGLRLVDGSEGLLLIEQREGDRRLFRQALPLVIKPEPCTRFLAERLLALEARRGAADGPFANEIGDLVAEGRKVFTEFVTGNLKRQKPMPAAEWRRIAGEHRRILSQLSGLAYVLWAKSPWAAFERAELPLSLKTPAQIDLVACGNEMESGVLAITNLSDRHLEGRLKVGPLRLTSGDVGGLVSNPNLLKNGNFTAAANQDGVPDGWRRVAGKGAFALEKQSDGSAAFVLSGASGEKTSTNFRQVVPLKAGETYTLIADMSAQDLPPNTGFLHVINSGWTWSRSLAPMGPTSGRMQYVVSFVAPKSPSLEVVLRLDTPAGGLIRYHSVKVVQGRAETADFSSECITLHDVVFQDLQVGKTVADPLPEMNQARTLFLPAGESRQVWVRLDTSALPPGAYASSVTLSPFDRRLPPKAVPLNITVLPVRLPDRMPIAVFNWDYARNELYVRDLAEHRNNTFLMSTKCLASFDKNGNLANPADWSSYDKMLQVKLRYARRHGGIVLFSYGIVRDFHVKHESLHGWEFMDEPWRKAFKTWVLEFERHLRDDLGMDYGEYAVQLWDEATGSKAELAVQGGRFMRSFAPRIRTCMDGAQSVAEVKAMDPMIDLWIPHQSALYHSKEAEQLRALYRALSEKGEPVWTYTCSTSMKSLHPLDYYRLKEWRVWELGLQGSCFWAYNSWRGDPWNDFDGPIADCGTVYDGPHGPITSRRWEATREGREDYLCLHLLRQAGKAAGGETEQAVESLLTDVVQQALAEPRDGERFESVRRRLLAALAEHCGAEPPQLTRRPGFAYEKGRVTCSWDTDRSAAGILFCRVPGDAEWRTTEFAPATNHVARLDDLPQQRSFEWYMLWWDERGALSCRLTGLASNAWFGTR